MIPSHTRTPVRALSALLLAALLLLLLSAAALSAPETTTTSSAGAEAASSDAEEPAADADAGVQNGTASGSAGHESQAADAPGPAFVQARAAILVNGEDGRVLYEKNADERLPMASTTKIMTGILAIEKLPLDRVVEASETADQAGESEIWLVPGEKLTVDELLYGVLVKSGNDAAVALAEAASGSVDAFVEEMNAKARELGLTNTHYTNPHGLDMEGHYSSARDLAELGRYAMQNEDFRRFVGTAETTISWPGHDYDRVLKNHNQLLGEVGFVNGVKTGYTGDAGYCLVGSGSQDGVSLISVTLGEETSDQRNADTVKLLEYGFSRYENVVFAERSQTLAELSVPYHIDETLPVITADRLASTVHVDDEVERVVTLPEELELPVESGQVLGTLRYTVDGQTKCQVDLVASRSIEAPTLGLKARYFFDRFLLWVGSAL